MERLAYVLMQARIVFTSELLAIDRTIHKWTTSRVGISCGIIHSFNREESTPTSIRSIRRQCTLWRWCLFRYGRVFVHAFIYIYIYNNSIERFLGINESQRTGFRVGGRQRPQARGGRVYSSSSDKTQEGPNRIYGSKNMSQEMCVRLNYDKKGSRACSYMSPMFYIRINF